MTIGIDLQAVFQRTVFCLSPSTPSGDESARLTELISAHVPGEEWHATVLFTKDTEVFKNANQWYLHFQKLFRSFASVHIV